MEIKELNRIKAIGNLLQYYHSDLTYILNFQKFKRGDLSHEVYLREEPGSFPSFIKEFRVMRNIEKDKVEQVLVLAEKWVDGDSADDVDGFAASLKKEGCTHGKQMTSLASKVLLLNDPWNIMPLDQWNKKALGIKENNYITFIKTLRSHQIDCSLVHEEEYLNEIEKSFVGHIRDIGTIRENRFKDKLLWVKGQSEDRLKKDGK